MSIFVLIDFQYFFQSLSLSFRLTNALDSELEIELVDLSELSLDADMQSLLLDVEELSLHELDEVGVFSIRLV